MSGWYRCTLVAPMGDGRGDDTGTLGSTVVADIYMTAHETVYVLVGGGSMGYGKGVPYDISGWNGATPGSWFHGVGTGSGATDIRTSSAGAGSTDPQTGYLTRLVVAGGGGAMKPNGPGPSESTASGSLWMSGRPGAGGGYYGGLSYGAGSSYIPNIPGRVRRVSFAPSRDYTGRVNIVYWSR